MTTDPPSLFLTAALAAGLVEGASVIRHQRRELLRRDDDADPSNDGVTRSVPSAPSVPAVAAYSLLYGVASVPLGAIGASPGFAFLPKSLSATANKAAADDSTTTNTTEDGTRHGRLNELPPAPLETPVVGTGRGVGRVLRQENSKKMSVYNQRRRHLEARHATSSGGAIPAPSAYSSLSSRYIATLDGRPLPTRLAEAMRRSRCLLVGAGMVSFAIMQCLSDDREDNVISHRLDAKYNHGYGQGISTGESISLWMERIKGGAMIDGYYGDTMRWINLQFGRELDEPLFGSIGDWIPASVKSETDNANASEQEEAKEERGVANDVDGVPRQEVDTTQTKEGDAVEANDASESSPTPVAPNRGQSKNGVWNAALVSVDVLGTSIRHLVVATCRVASAVAGVGRRGRPPPDEEHEEDSS